MRSIKEKLNSQKGASMLIVLGLLLICMMISSVVVTAAASGSSRNVRRIDQQRAYLSVSSAAEVILDELEKIDTYVVKKEKQDYACDIYYATPVTHNYGPVIGEQSGYEMPDGTIAGSVHAMITDVHADTDWEKSFDTATADGVFEQLVEDAVTAVYQDTLSGDAFEAEFDITLEGDSRLLPVTCRYTMDTSYHMKFALTVAGSDYAVTISKKAEYPLGSGDGTDNDGDGVLDDEDDDNEEFECTHTVYYQEDPSMDGKENTDYKIKGIKHVEKTSIKWKPATLVKGVVES